MKQTKINSVWHFAVFVALLWLLPPAQVASAQTKVSIIHAVVGPSEIPLWIAHEQGLFAKQGIDAQILLQETPGVARRITGDIQFGVIGIPATIAAVVEGSNLKILAPTSSARATTHLVVRPDVKTPDDLRGKRFGVFGIGTGFWIHAMLALEHLGLDPTRDRITFVEVGNLPRMARALETGEIDAAMLDPARSSHLRSKGFPMLLDMYPANISAVQNALVAAGQRVMALHDPRVLNLKLANLIEERFVRKLDERGVIDRLYSTYGVK